MFQTCWWERAESWYEDAPLGFEGGVAAGWMEKGKREELVLSLCSQIPPSWHPGPVPDIPLHSIFKKVISRVRWLRRYKLKQL